MTTLKFLEHISSSTCLDCIKPNPNVGKCTYDVLRQISRELLGSYEH